MRQVGFSGRVVQILLGLFVVVIFLVCFTTSQPQANASATQPPDQPQNFRVSLLPGINTVHLNWFSSNLHDANDAAHLRIERSAGTPSNWQIIAQISGSEAYEFGNYADKWRDWNVTYYYRLTLGNSFGEAAPVTGSVTIPEPPPAPTNLNATVLSGNSIRLNYTRNTPSPTSISIIERSDNSAGPWNAETTSYSDIYTSTSLIPGKTYYYRVLSDYFYSPTVASNIVSATTPGSVAIPATPDNFRLTVMSDQAISLHWNDSSDNETGFLIERSNSVSGPWLKFARINKSDQVGYQDQTLSPGTTYYYQVSAFNSVGTSAPSTPISGTTKQYSIVPARANAPSVSDISTSWYENSGDLTIPTGYRLERSLISPENWETVAILYTTDNTLPDDTHYTDWSRPINLRHKYRVVAFNSLGDGPPSDYNSDFYTASPPPASPSNLTLDQLSDASVALNWINNSKDAYNFNILRSEYSPYGPWEYIANIDDGKATSYVDTTLIPGRKYYYQVYATRGYYFSNPATSSISLAYNIPQIPQALAAYSTSDTTISLSWTKINNASVRLERSLDGVSNWTSLTTVSNASITSYTDTGLTKNTFYYYRLIANNDVGDSAPSRIANAQSGLSLQVSSNIDRGDSLDQDTAGTLSYALKHAVIGQTVTFSPTISSITLSGSLRPFPAGLTLLGNCSSANSLVTLTPSAGFVGPLLFNKGNITMWGLRLIGFKNVQITAANGTGNNHFICTKIG